jgi:hypothetical protein
MFSKAVPADDMARTLLDIPAARTSEENVVRVEVTGP